MSAGGVIPGAFDAREHDLLERLGLDERATAEDVARTRDELQAFLAAAPKSIRGWARRQASAADEAFVLLSDPTAWPGPGALPEPGARSASQPGGPATPPVRRATPNAALAALTATATATAVPAVSAASAVSAAPEALEAAAFEGDEDAAFEAMLAEVTPSMHRDRVAPRPDPAKRARSVATAPAANGRAATAGNGRAATAAARRRAAVPAPAGGSRRFPKVLAAMAGIAVLAVGVVAIYQFGSTPAVTGAQSTPAPTAALDQDKVAALMSRIQADPSDTAALLELGDAFFTAEEFETSIVWFEKLVALEPDNIPGLLALGAANYNLANDAEAKARWLEVLALEPDNVVAHYDLGFLYLNQAPPDYEAVRREWAEVVRLDPESDLAAFVSQHLEALPAPSADASAGTSPAPSAASSAAPSAAPTAPPTAAPSPTAVP
jgi:cytochrome c-type biogenesis protein CcmH/NrfG